MGSVGLSWDGFDWVELGWARLGWVDFDWVGVGVALSGNTHTPMRRYNAYRVSNTPTDRYAFSTLFVSK
jgi:hypothetical protein